MALPETVTITSALVIDEASTSPDAVSSLSPLLGLPVLARTLFALDHAGISDAYIAAGPRTSQAREMLRRVDHLKINVHWLETPENPTDIATAILQAEDRVSEPFVVASADRVFDPSIVEHLSTHADGLSGFDVGVDRDEARFGQSGATLVRTASREIAAIGAMVTNGNGVSTGIGLANRELFSAIRSTRNGSGSFVSALQALVAQGKLRATDTLDMMWHSISTRADLTQAERSLIRRTRKSTDGPISRRINRPISSAVSRVIVRIGARPNHVTVFNLALGLASGFITAFGGYVPFLIGGILFQLASIFDGTDGEVAKLTFRSSKWGEWFDTITDNITYLVCLVGLTIGAGRSGWPPIFQQSGVIGLTFATLSFVSLYAYLVRAKRSGSLLSVRYGFQDGTGIMSRFLRVAQYATKRDVFALGIMVLGILGILPVALLFFGVATIVLFLSSLGAHVRLAVAHR